MHEPGTSVLRMVCAVVCLLLVACSGNGGTGGGLAGSVTGDGSSTVFPITEAVAEEFHGPNPHVDVNVGVSGTGGGFKKFCNDETDIQDASRPIKDSEVRACAAKGVEWIELQVANDGLAVTVNRRNEWATCLTMAELKRIWSPRSGVRSWDAVRPAFPGTALKLFGPGTDSGTFDFFTEKVVGEEGASRVDYTASEDDNVLVQGVAGDEGALGYFGFAFFAENRDKLRILGIDAGSGCIVPEDESVKDGRYPLARPLFLYVKRAALARPEVRAFVTFYLETVNELVVDVGYTPLSESDLASQKSKLAADTGE